MESAADLRGWVRSRFFAVMTGVTLLGTTQGSTASQAAEPAGDPRPAQLAEALQVIDFRTWPLAPGDTKPTSRTPGRLNINATGSVKAVYDRFKGQLTAKGWGELPGGYESEQSSTASFKKEGFRVSLTVYDSGTPGTASVMLINHGNVDVASLPVPKDAKPFYNTPTLASLVVAAPVEQVTKECRELLEARGWKPYGDAADQHFFKQNAVRLSAFIHTAPAQGGKTVIDYSTELLSADLPAPADAKALQYSDSPTQIYFDTKRPKDEVTDFYKKTLGEAGWTPTLKNLTKSGFREFMIFRNPQKEMMTLEVTKVEDFHRVKVLYETAEQVAESQRRADEYAAKRKMEAQKAQMKKKPVVRIAVPQAAKDIELKKNQLEFKLEAGQAKGYVGTLRDGLVKEGWEVKVASLNDQAGVVSLSRAKENLDLTITYTDTGFLPTEISISTIGAELERAPAGQ